MVDSSRTIPLRRRRRPVLRRRSRLQPRGLCRPRSAPNFAPRHAAQVCSCSPARRGLPSLPRVPRAPPRQVSKCRTVDVLLECVRHSPPELCLFRCTRCTANLKARRRFEQNGFAVPQQPRRSRDEAQRSVDLGLFISDSAIFTSEFKHRITKQTLNDAIRRYRRDCNPKGPISDSGAEWRTAR